MIEQDPTCDYCENEAAFLEIISMDGPEGPLDYEYYVCQDHKGTKHHEMKAVEMWKKKRGLI